MVVSGNKLVRYIWEKVMKEILFKAKRVSDGVWVEGYPVKLGSYWRMHKDIHRFLIYPETLCQYLGTINNQKVFDGDKFKIRLGFDYFVKYENFQSIAFLENENGNHMVWGCLSRIIELGWENDFQITGNIHDNE